MKASVHSIPLRLFLPFILMAALFSTLSLAARPSFQQPGRCQGDHTVTPPDGALAAVIVCAKDEKSAIQTAGHSKDMKAAADAYAKQHCAQYTDCGASSQCVPRGQVKYTVSCIPDGTGTVTCKQKNESPWSCTGQVTQVSCGCK
jgi:hypothetical protein